ncbi:hypothetical protein EJ02DRAFT_343427, partial [Clathrospora elynae]
MSCETTRLQPIVAPPPLYQSQNILRASSSACQEVVFQILTPKKARIKGAADFMDAKGIPYFHTNLFEYYNVSKEAGWAIIKQDNE